MAGGVALLACSGYGSAGAVDVDGSSTVAPITEAVAEEYAKVGEAAVSVGISGTGGGFDKFCRGETDINDASRPIKDSERALCAERGVTFREFPIGADALTIAVSADNDFTECITFSQLRAIWDRGSTVERWSDIDPSYPDESIRLYAPGADSGTFDYFTDAVNGTAGRSRSNYVSSEDDNVLVEGVARDGDALGYFGYAYFRESEDELRALAVDMDVDGDGEPVADDERRGCVAPSDETVRDATYPLSRPLYVYVSDKALARPRVLNFLRFYMEEADTLVAEIGYTPLQDEQYAANLAALGEQ
jgi:phosphate transport system substrate-binding protein